MVSRKQGHFAGGVAGGYAHPIAVGVCGYDKVRAGFIGEFHGHVERFGVFWVRRFDGWEAAIGHVLFGHGLAVEAEPVEHRLDDNASHTMQGH